MALVTSRPVAKRKGLSRSDATAESRIQSILPGYLYYKPSAEEISEIAQMCLGDIRLEYTKNLLVDYK